jgi:hypothetical protein
MHGAIDHGRICLFFKIKPSKSPGSPIIDCPLAGSGSSMERSFENDRAVLGRQRCMGQNIGLVLAATFVIEDRRGGSPFLVTMTVHAMRNGMTTLYYALSV